MELTKTQIENVKKLVAAKKALDKSGLKMALLDEWVCLFDKKDNLSFDNLNNLDYYTITGLGMINSYGL